MGGRMLVICIEASKSRRMLKSNKIYNIYQMNDMYYRISDYWWSKKRFKKLKLYPDSKIFRELYPDAIEYQGYLGVKSEIEL